MTQALTEIRYSTCRLKDKRAFAALGAVHPLATFARKSYRTANLPQGEAAAWHTHNPNSGEAHYAVCDGVLIECAIVTDVSAEGAARILAELLSLTTVWDESTFRAAVVRALGATEHVLQ